MKITEASVTVTNSWAHEHRAKVERCAYITEHPCLGSHSGVEFEFWLGTGSNDTTYPNKVM
jgi:formylmethanofuran dehydrogenase subunit E-like metal-binding protein